MAKKNHKKIGFAKSTAQKVRTNSKIKDYEFPFKGR